MIEELKNLILQTERFFQSKENIKLLNPVEKRESVTKLDIEIEDFLIENLKNIEPGAGFLSEERGENRGKNNKFWIIDPIDSTNNFLLNIPFFSVSIAYCKKNIVEIGLCYFPRLKELFYAQRGKGAFLNNKTIRVSEKDKLKNSLLLYDNQFYKTELTFTNLKKIVNEFFTVRISGCASFDICMVASGRAEARIFNDTKPMDFIPGSIILEEAGGKISNFDGNYPDFKDTKIICSNNLIHENILNILKKDDR